jgi:nucleoside-diphosphate-sugar epimerase/predicted dehydrogenase
VRAEVEVGVVETGIQKDVLQVGFLGAGYIAEWHAKALEAIPRARLVAVCDKDPGRARAFASRHGGIRAYQALDEMLSDASHPLDAVHVLLPADLHADAAITLINKKIDVLLEKPTAITVEQCDEIIRLAEAGGVKIGTNHNFLFSDVYERLREDLKAGRLGRPDQVTVTWQRGLDQLQSGPFNLWMLRDPRNILLEIGPHCLAPLLDLLGPIEISSVRASNPITLPGGGTFYRRWNILAEAGPTAAAINLSFAPGFTEHLIHIRGSLANATADYERNTYLLHQHTPYGLDVDRYRMTRREAGSLAIQARRTLTRYLKSRLKLSTEGSPYGLSIAAALSTFYDASGPDVDSRLSTALGREAVARCVAIGWMGVPQRPGSETAARAQPTLLPPRDAAPPPDITILGASGFIGQELARQLVAAGRRIRVLVRNPGRLPEDLKGPQVELVVGDLTRPEAVAKALEGCRYLFHLARANVKTWEEFQQQDIEVTRTVAELSLAAGVERLIYTGTIDSYYAGARADTITEATPLDPQIKWRNLYARAKAASEEILWELHRTRGLPVTIFRPGIVVGQGGSPFHWGIGMWSWNTICRVWGRGNHPLPFVLVQDVAHALIAALEAPGIAGESFNLVAETDVSAWDYLESFERHAGVCFQKYPAPPWKFYAADLAKYVVKRCIGHPDRRRPSYRDWETRTQRARYDCSKARKMLNWNPVCDREEFIRLGIQQPCDEYLA